MPLQRSLLGERLRYAGRNEAVRILWTSWMAGDVPLDDIRKNITAVWSTAEWPASIIGVDEWVRMFRAVGFVADDDEPPPAAPLELYRGTTWGRRRGMSWTRDIDRARWFARRLQQDDGLVFRLLVPAEAVLAFVGFEGRTENEVVVDPRVLPPVGRSAIVT